MSHRGHRSSLALVLAPMFELRGEGAEHTFYSFLHRAATPHHLTTNTPPITLLALEAWLPSGERLALRLQSREHHCGFCQISVLEAPELGAGTEIRLRVKDASVDSDRRWRLQRSWPMVSRPRLVSQAALVVLVA